MDAILLYFPQMSQISESSNQMYEEFIADLDEYSTDNFVPLVPVAYVVAAAAHRRRSRVWVSRLAFALQQPV